MTDRSWKTLTPEISVYFKTLAINTYLPPIRIPCECCAHTDEDLGRYHYLKLTPPYIPLRMLVRSRLYRNYSPSTPAYFIDGVCPLLFSDYQECCDECDRLNAIDMDITKAKNWIEMMYHTAIIIRRRV